MLQFLHKYKKETIRTKQETVGKESNLKFRNIKVAKIIGTKTLAGLLSVGLAMSAPIAAFAEDGNVAVTQTAAGMQAKAVDGSENLVNVSDSVLQMVQNGEVYLYTFERTESGDPVLANIESDEEYAKAAVAFDTVLQNAKDHLEKID